MQLLLFGLGMEFSVDKLREVGSVAIIGGFAQIVLLIATCAAGALAIGARISEGIFVGALLSMSSTSVVIKSLGERAADKPSQIVIGTLILQDCSVGLMFALMPVLSSLNDPSGGFDLETSGAIVALILQACTLVCCTLHVAPLSLASCDSLANMTCCGWRAAACMLTRRFSLWLGTAAHCRSLQSVS